MKFKRRPYNLTYETQGLIYFTCQDYKNQSERVQEKIVGLCLKCGGEHYQAVFEAVTTANNLNAVARKHFIDESWLCKLVKRFYESWSE